MTRAGLGLPGHAWLAMAGFWLGAHQPSGQAMAAADDGAKMRPGDLECDGLGVSHAGRIDRALANALAQEGGVDLAAGTAQANLALHGSAVHGGNDATGPAFAGVLREAVAPPAARSAHATAGRGARIGANLLASLPAAGAADVGGHLPFDG